MAAKYKKVKREGRLIDKHRYIMQCYLGRVLAFDEVVHHINEDKLDNRIENLQLMTRSEHAKLHCNDFNGFRKKLKKGEWTHNKRCQAIMVSIYNGEDLMAFRSQSMAAQSCKVDRRMMGYVLEGKRKHSKGFVFRVINKAS